MIRKIGPEYAENIGLSDGPAARQRPKMGAARTNNQ